MEYFKKYVSNTIAGSSNQAVHFTENENKEYKSRAYYKVNKKGRYGYSFLFSNIIDSIFVAPAHRNLICSSWKICKMRVGVCDGCNMEYAVEPEKMFNVTFNGKYEKCVMPGEFFCTDEIELDCSDKQYICIEITFKGKMIPYHHEILVPVFREQNSKWVSSKIIPAVNMIGCKRYVRLKIGYLGDSITQGIGTKENSYKHWNAILSEKLGEDYAYWNLGIGCASSADAASDGA